MWRHLVAAVAVACLLPGCGGGGDRPRARSSTTPTATPPAQIGGQVTYCAGNYFPRFERTTVRRFNDSRRTTGSVARFRSLAGDIQTPRGYIRFLRAVDRRLGAGCDVVLVPVGLIGALAAGGALLELTSYVESRRDEFVGATLDTARYADRYWGLPRAIGAALLYYWTDRGAPPATWQEAYELARRKGGLVYAGAPNAQLTQHFLELAYSAGGRVLSEDGATSVIDGPQNLRVLRFMRRGIAGGAVPRAVTRSFELQALRAFASRRPAHLRSSYYGFDDDFTELAFSATELPAFGYGRPVSILNGHSLVVAAEPRSERAAMAFVDFLTGEDEVERAYGRAKIAPALKVAWEEPRLYGTLSFSSELHRSIEQARAMPVSPVWPWISFSIAVNVHDALTGRATPREALRAADRQINRAIRAGPRVGEFS
jgi:multiple sugar transport system substrate-binding protein